MINYWDYFDINKDSDITTLENAYMEKFKSLESNFSTDNSDVIKDILFCNKAFDTLIKPNLRYEHDHLKIAIKSTDIIYDPIIFDDNIEFDIWLENTFNKYFEICKNASDSELTWNINIMNILQISIGLNQIKEYIQKEKGYAKIR